MPTTGISLIRLHTEKTTPPRALWVPFELGRPLGVPHNVGFQSKVLQSALSLLERTDVPIIEDFPEDAPESGTEPITLACPVSFTGNKDDLGDTEKFTEDLKAEMAGMQNWYDLAVEKRGRTTVGISGLDLDFIPIFVGEFLRGRIPENPRSDIDQIQTLKLAIDDLKAFYNEAVTAQPGQESVGSRQLNQWFWKETTAGRAIFALRDICRKSDNKMLNLVGTALLIPVGMLER